MYNGGEAASHSPPRSRKSTLPASAAASALPGSNTHEDHLELAQEHQLRQLWLEATRYREISGGQKFTLTNTAEKVAVAVAAAEQRSTSSRSSGHSRASCSIMGSRLEGSEITTPARGPKMVASRYMQAAAARAAPRREIPAVSKNKDFRLTPSAAHGRPGQTPAPTTSTPYANLSRLATDSIDASVIFPTSSAAAKQRLPDRVLADACYSRRLKCEEPTKRTITQSLLDVLYSRYVQWLYCELKAKKSFEDQESRAMAQLHTLWEINREQLGKLARLDSELIELRYADAVDSLGLQDEVLSTIVAELPQVGSQYTTMASALECSRSRIAIRGVFTPDEVDTVISSYCDSLLVPLAESESLLTKLAPHIGQEELAARISRIADITLQLERKAEQEVLELRRLQEATGAFKALTTKEASLRMGLMDLARARSARFC